jgi:DNA-binding beta-propeller fold protein YncE
MARSIAVLLACLVAVPAAAELQLPPGFTAEVYVTGQGFDSSSERGIQGFPAASTLGLDPAGMLYVAKTGARFRSGEVDDLSSIYRFPVGGTRLSPDTEARFFHGPPLRSPQVAAVRGRADVFVTTYDRDRQIGALYRLTDGRAVLFAGGTPPRGTPPLLKHPEGVAVDAAGHVYVADREQGLVVRLDPTGQVVDPKYLRVMRARMLAFDEQGHLWIASDGTAETPFRDGVGQILRATPDGRLSVAVEGPLVAGMSPSPGGALFVAQRRSSRLFVVTPQGRQLDFAGVTEGSYLRGLAFAPVTPETRRAGIAGDLFLIAIPRQMWAINEVIRVSGPFDAWVRQKTAD